MGLSGAQLPTIKAGGVESANAFGGYSVISPGSWIEIYGSNLAIKTRPWAASDFNGINAPTSLESTTVTIGGEAAFIDYVSPGQINAQVPSNAPIGPQAIVVTTAAGPSAPYSIIVAATAPGLLAPSSFLVGEAQNVAALFSDGTTYVLPPGAIPGLPARRAQPGDNITLYGVGFGPVAPDIPAGQVVGQYNSTALPFNLMFGDMPAPITYHGLAPGNIGLYQFDVVVPSIPSNDLTPLSFTLNGVLGTQTLYIAVQNGFLLPELQSVALSLNAITGGGSVRGTVTLASPAPNGDAVVALASSSSTASVPPSVTVRAGSTSASFTIATAPASSNETVTISAVYADTLAQAILTVLPAPPVFLSLTIADTYQFGAATTPSIPIAIFPNGDATYSVSINGGDITFTNGTFTNQDTVLSANVLKQNSSTPPYGVFAPPANGMYLVSSASIMLTFGPFNPVFAGANQSIGDVSGPLKVTGTPYPRGGAPVTLSGILVGKYSAILPASVAPRLQGLLVSPSSVTGGGAVQGTVTLSSAPTADIVVALSSSSTAASVPATLTIPAGSTSATFAVVTVPGSSSQTSIITATYSGVSAQAALNITR